MTRARSRPRGGWMMGCALAFVALLSVARLTRGPDFDMNVSNTEPNLPEEEPEEDPFVWVEEYQKDFPFTMEQSPVCRLSINDDQILKDLARVAIADWDKKGGYHQPYKFTTIDKNEVLTNEMVLAEKTWNHILTACHGPLFDSSVHPEFAANYTLRAFMKGLAHCAHRDLQRGGHVVFEKEWCIGGWRDVTSRAFHEDLKKEEEETPFSSDLRENVFVLASRCALKLEFPIVPSLPPSDPKWVTNRQTNRQKKPKNWKPKRAIILTPTMGSMGATMGCRLVTTAYPRGWEVVLIEGEYKGIRYKYSDAIRALHLVVEESDIAAEDTLVVFADSMDVLVQRTPEYVGEAFLGLTSLFAFSAEPYCFPLGTWPHSLGVPYRTCDEYFPVTKNHYRNGNKYANTGGWIGLASSAFVVLKELAMVVENEGVDRTCHEFGTDQLLGNAAYLRSPSLVGLDYEYAVFASDLWNLMNDTFTQLIPSSSKFDDNNLIYGSIKKTATGEDTVLGPAFLHFNGGGSSGGLLEVATEALSSKKSLTNCRKGVVTIVNFGDEIVWREDFSTTERWRECSANYTNNSCANRD